MKNSDSDYKAEDEGSASDAATKKKTKGIAKKMFSLKLTKKEIIEKALKNFLPEGVTLAEGKGVSEAEYHELENVDAA